MGQNRRIAAMAIGRGVDGVLVSALIILLAVLLVPSLREMTALHVFGPVVVGSGVAIYKWFSLWSDQKEKPSKKRRGKRFTKASGLQMDLDQAPNKSDRDSNEENDREKVKA